MCVCTPESYLFITHVHIEILTRLAGDIDHNIEACWPNHWCRGKAASIRYSDCVSVFVASLPDMLVASFLHSIMLTSVAGLAVPYFSTLSHKWHDYQEKKLLNVKYLFLLCLQLLSEAFLILSRVQWDTTINLRASSCSVPCIFVRFNQTGILLTDFQKNPDIANSWISVQW